MKITNSLASRLPTPSVLMTNPLSFVGRFSWQQTWPWMPTTFSPFIATKITKIHYQTWLILGKKIVSTHSRLLNKGWSSMIDFNACQIVIVYLYPLLDLNLQFVQKKPKTKKTNSDSIVQRSLQTHWTYLLVFRKYFAIKGRQL